MQRREPRRSTADCRSCSMLRRSCRTMPEPPACSSRLSPTLSLAELCRCRSKALLHGSRARLPCSTTLTPTLRPSLGTCRHSIRPCRLCAQPCRTCHLCSSLHHSTTCHSPSRGLCGLPCRTFHLCSSPRRSTTCRRPSFRLCPSDTYRPSSTDKHQLCPRASQAWPE
jgi:hypothetical protein